MKKKKVLMTPPIMTKKKGTVITVQSTGSILILNMFHDRRMYARYAMETETGEYQVFEPEKAAWKQQKAYLAAGGDLWNGAYAMEKEVVYDPPGSEQQILAMLPASWRKEPLSVLDLEESRYLRKQSERREERRLERLEDLERQIPTVPEGFRRWIFSAAAGGMHYAFWDGEKEMYACTACKSLHALPGRHNEKAVCPNTGETVTLKRRTDHVSMWTRACLMQDMDASRSVCRHFDVELRWDGTGETAVLREAVRVTPMRMHPTLACRIYYNQYTRNDGGVRFDDKGNWANRRMRSCYLYPEGIQECLGGTEYEEWADLFCLMAGRGQKADYNELMRHSAGKLGAMEYLVKGRFCRLVEEVSANPYSDVNLAGKDSNTVFGIRDVQKINRIRDENGGIRMLNWMKWEERTGKRISTETLRWLDRQGIEPGRVSGIPMTPEKLKNYLERQKRESWPTWKMTTVLEQYKDYLDMCGNLNRDITDPMIGRPRELKRRHDELVAEIQRREMIRRAQNEKEAALRREQELKEQYPGAEENLMEVRDLYSYSNGEYRMIVPQSLYEIVLEGNLLHHCAGATNRYFDRIAARETYIFFLRRESDPDTPYYTIEAEPGGTIRQHRTMYDEETGIEEVRAFLREWQQAVKKRLNRKELEYARISAVKRQENLEELRRKNNTRVLNALMEDFMEAI